MEFEYPIFDAKEEAFIDFEAPMKGENNGEEYSESMKAFYCTEPGCKKSFRYRSEILRHMVTHTNKRPYVCPYKNCMKGFKRSDALATHMRIHTREKTFECPYGSCKSTFSTKAGLKYHTLKHKTEKHSLKTEIKEVVYMEQESGKQNSFAMDFSADAMMEAPLEGVNFQKQFSAFDFGIENPANDSVQFDNTHIQQISPMNAYEKAMYSENPEFDTYMTNYSSHSNRSSNASKDVDSHLNYHYTNASQNVMSCAANLINTEDMSTLAMSKTNSDSSLLDMIQKMVEENSNLKKRLDYYQQQLMRGPQFQREEQSSIF